MVPLRSKLGARNAAVAGTIEEETAVVRPCRTESPAGDNGCTVGVNISKVLLERKSRRLEGLQVTTDRLLSDAVLLGQLPHRHAIPPCRERLQDQPLPNQRPLITHGYPPSSKDRCHQMGAVYWVGKACATHGSLDLFPPLGTAGHWYRGATLGWRKIPGPRTYLNRTATPNGLLTNRSKGWCCGRLSSEYPEPIEPGFQSESNVTDVQMAARRCNSFVARELRSILGAENFSAVADSGRVQRRRHRPARPHVRGQTEPTGPHDPLNMGFSTALPGDLRDSWKTCRSISSDEGAAANSPRFLDYDEAPPPDACSEPTDESSAASL